MKKRTRFSSLPIQTQFASISIFVAVVTIFVMLIMTRSAITMELDSAVNHATLSLEKSDNDLKTLATCLDVIASSFQSSEDCKSVLSKKSYKEITGDSIDRINDDISYIKCLYPEIADVALVNDLVHWSSLYSEDDLLEMFNEEQTARNLFGHSIGFRESSFPIYASKTYYVYCSHVFENSVSIGCVLISIDLEKLSFTSISDEGETLFAIMDETGESYIITGDSDSFVTEVLPLCKEKLNDPELLKERSSFKTKNFYTSIAFSSATDFYLISSVSLPGINNSYNRARNQMIILAVLTLLLVSLLLWVLYYNLIRPLQDFVTLIRSMDEEKRRHISEPLQINGCQQVMDLSRSFTSLFSTIEDLNVKIFEASSKLYEEKIRGQETEISYFRSQINPHFLYNVLELIKSLALKKDAPEIADIAIAMGKMYRYNTKGAPIVPFREELEMTKAYIEIQKYRFKDKFDVIMNVPEEVMDVPVIKILLQPLVENSIGHGIEPSLTNCTLYVGCTLTDSSFDIEVRDDGIGIPADKLAELTALLSNNRYDTSTYVGILNTNARIKLQYGDEYGISIQSFENDGTVVKIHLPAPSVRLPEKEK